MGGPLNRCQNGPDAKESQEPSRDCTCPIPGRPSRRKRDGPLATETPECGASCPAYKPDGVLNTSKRARIFSPCAQMMRSGGGMARAREGKCVAKWRTRQDSNL